MTCPQTALYNLDYQYFTMTNQTKELADFSLFVLKYVKKRICALPFSLENSSLIY